MDINIVNAFVEGLVSFFSPCVVPLIPLYFGYLTTNAKEQLADGSFKYNRQKVLIQTLAFVLGISFAFILLGITFSGLGHLLNEYQSVFQIIAGIMIIVLALFQLNIIKLNFLNQEKRIQANLKLEKMNPVMAFVLGFLFSFTWTPCIGPALSSILLLVASNANGYWYILIYTLGFILPFIALGLFTSEVLNFLKKKKNILPMITKIGAVILLLMGSYSLYLGCKPLLSNNKQEQKEETIESASFEFELKDVDGKVYRLSDYQGKVIYYTFITTWCGYCAQEVELLQQEYLKNDPEVVIIGVLVTTNETAEDIRRFIQLHNLTFPIVIDENGVVASSYGVNGYPMGFVINKNYEMLGYVPGYIEQEVLESVIAQAKE